LKHRLVRGMSWITFVVVLISVLVGGVPFESRVLAAEAPASDGWNVLIDNNFDNYSTGTNAETIGYNVYKPMYEQGNARSLQGDAYVAQAPGGTGNSLYVYDNYNSVSEVVYSNNTRIVRTFAKQEGIVVAEVSFMQPGPQRERTKVLNLLSSNGDYIARITADPGQEKFVFDAKTGPDNMYPYETNKWYNIKLVVDIVNDQVMVYVDGNLCFSKQPTVEVRSAGTTASEKIKQNIAMLEIITAGGSPNPINSLFVDNIKVYAKPPAESAVAPSGVKAYPRDKEIYVEWIPSASYRTNNVYVATKPNATDSEYVKVIDRYNKKFVPNDYVSFTKLGTASSSPPVENGKTYYVKVTQNTRLLARGSDSEVESPLSLSQPVEVTPGVKIALDSTASSVIKNVYVNDTANIFNWSVQNNLAEGSMPYGDTSSVITKLPASYAGADWIKTANASNAYTGSEVLTTFNLTDDADVIVAVSRKTLDANKSWLSSWTKTGEAIELDSGAAIFDLYKKSFRGNTEVALSKIGQTDCNGYFVIVKGRSLSFTDSNGNQVSKLSPGMDINAKVELTNNTTEAQSFVVICALYNDKNSMVNYTNMSVVMGAGEKKTVYTGIKVPPDSSGYRVKAFLWDSLKAMNPLSSSITLQ
jgi:hypothetical protein